MNYEPIVIGKTRLPIQFQAKIMARAFKEKELISIFDSYTNAKLRLGRMGPPTDLQYKLAEARKAGKTTNEVASSFKVRKDQVYGAVGRVSSWEYLGLSS